MIEISPDLSRVQFKKKERDLFHQIVGFYRNHVWNNRANFFLTMNNQRRFLLLRTQYSTAYSKFNDVLEQEWLLLINVEPREGSSFGFRT
jgi:hypothetical protein